jgi:GcrA cell cycle regulator
MRIWRDVCDCCNGSGIEMSVPECNVVCVECNGTGNSAIAIVNVTEVVAVKRYHNEWAPERVVELKRRFYAGESFGTIAIAMGVTRNSIGGKCDRLGLRRDPLQPKKRERRYDPSRNKKLIKVLAGPVCSPIPLPPTLNIDYDIPMKQRKNILNIGPRDCRYIVGDPRTADWFFCGACKLAGCSYCAEHTARCYDRRI